MNLSIIILALCMLYVAYLHVWNRLCGIYIVERERERERDVQPDNVNLFRIFTLGNLHLPCYLAGYSYFKKPDYFL